MCLYNLSNKKNRYGYSIVTETIKKMKQGKAGGPSGVIVEMIKWVEGRLLLRYQSL